MMSRSASMILELTDEETDQLLAVLEMLVRALMGPRPEATPQVLNVAQKCGCSGVQTIYLVPERARRKFYFLEGDRLPSPIECLGDAPETNGAEAHISIEPVMHGGAVDAGLVG